MAGQSRYSLRPSCSRRCEALLCWQPKSGNIAGLPVAGGAHGFLCSLASTCSYSERRRSPADKGSARSARPLAVRCTGWLAADFVLGNHKVSISEGDGSWVCLVPVDPAPAVVSRIADAPAADRDVPGWSVRRLGKSPRSRDAVADCRAISERVAPLAHNASGDLDRHRFFDFSQSTLRVCYSGEAAAEPELAAPQRWDSSSGYSVV